jgi:hypothetical protein
MSSGMRRFNAGVLVAGRRGRLVRAPGLEPGQPFRAEGF